MALRSRVAFAYRSAGVRGVLCGSIRKVLFPFLVYERFVVLRAPLPQPRQAATGPIAYTIVDREGTSSLMVSGWRDAEDTIRRYRATPPDDGLRLAIALHAGELVGVCLFERGVIGLPGVMLRAPLPSYFVHFIVVREDMRGRGIMGRLLDCADSDAMQGGAKWRLCLVASHNRASLAGFAKSGSLPFGVVQIFRIFGRPVYMLPTWLRHER